MFVKKLLALTFVMLYSAFFSSFDCLHHLRRNLGPAYFVFQPLLLPIVVVVLCCTRCLADSAIPPPFLIKISNSNLASNVSLLFLSYY